MKAYKITPEQKAELENQTFASSQFFNPVQDINGEWFIFEQEFEVCGFGVESDFVPPLPTEII